MFQMLAILVVLNFSSRGDGAPHVTLAEGEKNTAAGNITDHQDLNLNHGDGLNEANLALKESTGLEPSLKPRTLGDSDDTGNRREATTKRRDTKKSTNKTKASTSKPGRETRGKKRGREEPSGTAAEPINPEESSGQGATGAVASHRRQGSLSPEGRQPTPPARLLQLAGYSNRLPLQEKRETANDLVDSANFFLTLPGKDPLKDRETAGMIDAAVYAYGMAYNRPPLSFPAADYKTVTAVKWAEFKDILEDRKTRKQAASSSKKPSGSQTVYETVAGARLPKDEAELAVNLARSALDVPGANPYTDEVLAHQIELAIEKYNKAHGRPPFRPRGYDNKIFQMNQKMAALREIFKEVDRDSKDLGDVLTKLEAAQQRQKN